MKKAWFSAAEIAAQGLAEMPTSKRGVARLAEVGRWDKTDQARVRSGRGGGLEYHFSLLPAAAQAMLVTRYGAVDTAAAPKAVKRATEAPAPRGAAAWAGYETLPSVLKDRAVVRLDALVRIDGLSRRVGRAAAIRSIAEEMDVTVATLHNWLDLVRGVARADWLPALAPKPRGGGGRKVEIDERAWDIFRADYLRPSEPSFTSCYRRLADIARRDKFPMPNERTLRRRVDEIPESVLVMSRKGRDATKALFPPQERDRTGLHALEAVNADGHKWDVFVKWPDGKISRPLMVAFQDLYSGMFLAWRIARSENQDLVRLVFGDMIETYGVPDWCLLDNGRAFASKRLTGGTPNRYRFKVKPEEPLGVMTQLGVQIKWATPYHGQAKPIERGFGDFARDISKHPAFQGAYCGNSPMAKPEDYGSAAVPIELFTQIINQEIAKHNAREGRTTKVCGGKLSFQQAFEASYAVSPIRLASAEQRRMCMLMAEGVKVRKDGAIFLLENRYWNEKLLEHRGQLLTVRFDPENVQEDLAVYAQDGSLVCVAQLIEAAGFADTNAAREHAAARNAYLRATKERLAAEKVMSLKDLVALQSTIESYEPPEAKIIRPIFQQTRGNLALKPIADREAEEDAIDQNFAKAVHILRDVNQEI